MLEIFQSTPQSLRVLSLNFPTRANADYKTQEYCRTWIYGNMNLYLSSYYIYIYIIYIHIYSKDIQSLYSICKACICILYHSILSKLYTESMFYNRHLMEKCLIPALVVKPSFPSDQPRWKWMKGSCQSVQAAAR